MAKLYNLAGMTTTTTGTGTITLGSAIYGHLTFAQAGIANNDTVTYAIKDGANSEIGRGVYTSSGTTLTRTVLRSTNSNAALNLSGSAEVFITPAAEDFSEIDAELALRLRFDAAQSLTPTQQAQALTNLGIVTPDRENIVINGEFAINQRAFAGGALAAGVYGFDRWKGRDSADLSLISGGVTISAGSIEQVIEPAAWGYASLSGVPLTISIDAPSTNVDVEVLTASGVSGTITAGSGRRSVTLTPNGAGNVRLFLIPLSFPSEIRRVKVEVGTVATAYVPRPLTTETLLCQRYFYRISGELFIDSYDGAGGAYYFSYLPFPARMRATPTASSTLGTVFNVFSPGGVPQAGAGAHNDTAGTIYVRGNVVGRMYAFINNPAWSAEL